MSVLSIIVGIILGLIGSAISQSITAQTELNNRIASNLRAQNAVRQALGQCAARDAAIRATSQQLQQVMDRGESFVGQQNRLTQKLTTLRAQAAAVPDSQLWADLVELERQGRNLRTYQPFRGISFRLQNIRWNVLLTIFSLVQLLFQIRAWRASSIAAEEAALEAMNTPCDSGQEVNSQNIRLVFETIDNI